MQTPDSGLAACIDIGGSKALVGLVDRGGKILARERYPSPPGVEPAELVRRLGARVHTLAGAAGLDWQRVVGVGYSTAGMMDVERGIIFSSPNQGDWRDVPFMELLKREFQLPARIEMDANAAAIGEAWLGAGQGADPLVFLVIGTGVGSGILVNGRVLRGWNGTAGEIGHTVIDLAGPACNCGNKGCLESLVSGPAIARRARQAGSPAGEDELSAEAVFQAARAGDPAALAVVAETVELLSIGVTNLIHLLNPKAIILGGGVGQGGADLLLEPLKKAVSRRVGSWVDFDGTLIARSQLGSDAGLLGAAWLVWNELVKEIAT
jgi:glucokinase